MRRSTKRLSQRILNIVLVCGVVALNVSCTARDIYPDARPDNEILMRQWTRSTHMDISSGVRGNEFSNPEIYENTLIFGTQNGGLISLYPIMNRIRWVLPIENGVLSRILVQNDTVYFGAGDGQFYAVDAQTGQVKWRYEVRSPVVSQPLYFEDKIFITSSDDTVYALRADTGEWLWHYRRRSGATATIQGVSTPVAVDDYLLAGLSDGFLVALSRSDGRLMWEKRLHEGRKFIDVDGTPIVDGKDIYVPSYDGAFYSLGKGGQAVFWKFDAGSGKKASLDGDILYLPSSDGFVYALSKQNGKMLWKFELDQGVSTEIAVSDHYLFFGSTHRYLYALRKRDGKLVFRYDVGKGTGYWGSPLYDKATQRLYIISGNGNLFSYRVRGEEKRRKPFQILGLFF